MESNRLSPERHSEVVHSMPGDAAQMYERASNLSSEHREAPRREVAESLFSGPVLPTPAIDPVTNSLHSDAASLDDAATSDLPVAANDEDLIEKEWVDKLKSVISDTKNDPYRREQEVARVQKDYLKKRYGKDLGVTQDN